MVGRPVIEELAAITVLVIFLDDKKKTCVNCGSEKSQGLKKIAMTRALELGDMCGSSFARGFL